MGVLYILNGVNCDWQNLVENLKSTGVLKTQNIISAFENIDRKNFVIDEYKDSTYADTALPIGKGQTISQPYTVAFMLELLQPRAGDRILDIGYGSGWQTSLLAHVVSKSKSGVVFAMEIVPELCELGKTNISKYNFIEKGTVECFCKSAEKGLEEKAPFNGIIAAAALGGKIPKEWKEQLKVGGRIVVPVKNSIWLFTKIGDNKFKEYEHPGFAFVPFV